MQVFWGKGLFVILGGCLVGAPPPWYLQFITFVYCMCLGFGYIIAHFCCGGGCSGGGGGGFATTATTTTRTTRTNRSPAGGRTRGLPRGWTAAVDKSSGQTYYVNGSTGATQWERP